MRNSNSGNLAKLTTLAASLLFSSSLAADSEKRITRTIDASSLNSVEIEASIAEMEIEFYEGDEIELEIDVEADGNWLAWRRGNVDNVELDVRTTENSLYLGITDRKIGQHWRVKMPAKLAMVIDVGVGEIELDDFANSLQLSLGVGEVHVDVNDTEYSLIHASAGVGDTDIRGFSNEGIDNERSFVSSDSYHHGDGDFEIEIEVGVGDVLVRSR